MSIRQGNSPRSRITQRIWPASRCGPQSHRGGTEEANQAAAPAPQAATSPRRRWTAMRGRVIRTLFIGSTVELVVWEMLFRDRNSYSLTYYHTGTGRKHRIGELS